MYYDILDFNFDLNIKFDMLFKNREYSSLSSLEELFNLNKKGGKSCVLAIFSYSKVSITLILPLFSSLQYKQIEIGL